MEGKKKVNLLAVILACICAVIWNINVVLDSVHRYTDSVAFALHILCAISWDICAAAWILRYIKFKKTDE